MNLALRGMLALLMLLAAGVLHAQEGEPVSDEVVRDREFGVSARHFGLEAEQRDRILALAEERRRRSVDHFEFTSVLHRDYDIGQKMVLAEVMWGLALADGHIAVHEHYLTRKIANLLDLEPGYLSSAKAAAGRRRPETAPDGTS